jgi:hypothetical protein
MRDTFLFFALCFLVLSKTYAGPKLKLSPTEKLALTEKLKPFHSPSAGQLQELIEGQVFSEARVHSPTKGEQQLKLFVAAIHPRSCTRALRKLSLYENYPQYMDFIKQGQYDEKAQKITFHVDHLLLPFPMILSFKFPRLTGPGHYPFTLESGFLKNLQGTIGVAEVAEYCLLSLKADWKGPDTPIPNVAFELFLQTVGKLGLEHLIRVSRF